MSQAATSIDAESTTIPFAQRTLPAVLSMKATSNPHRPFILGCDEEVSLGDLRDRVARFAGGLVELGAARGEPVLIWMHNSVDAVVAMFGVTWLGGLEVPVNTGYKGPMLAHIVNDSQAKILILDEELLPTLEGVAEELENLQTIVVAGRSADDPASLSRLQRFDWDGVARGSLIEAAPIAPSDLIAIMYTSGTTGASKGVMTYHHQAYQYANLVPANVMQSGDISYVTLPLFHIGGQWAGVYAALLDDGQVVLKRKFSVGDFWADIDRFGVTQTILLGAMADFLFKQEPRADDAAHSLRRVTMGPAPRQVDEFAARFKLRVCQAYGSTEVGGVTAPQPEGSELDDPRTVGWVRGDIYELRIVDGDDRPVADGIAGEAIVRPLEPFVCMAGYWGQPEATVAAWRNLWFHTGDVMVRRADGALFLLDRLRDTIRRRGENVSSMEVEREVLSHDAVLECAVFSVPSSHFSDEEIKAAVVVRAGAAITPAELAVYLEPRMPSFMVPRYIEFVGTLPRTPTEKVSKASLRAAGLTGNEWDRLPLADK